MEISHRHVRRPTFRCLKLELDSAPDPVSGHTTDKHFCQGLGRFSTMDFTFAFLEDLCMRGGSFQQILATCNTRARVFRSMNHSSGLRYLLKHTVVPVQSL